MTRVSHIKENIKAIRRVNNLTQSEFGKLFGLSRDQVYTYESGVTTPPDWVIVRIAKYAKVSPDHLLFNLMDEVEIPVYSKYEAPDSSDVNEPDGQYKVLTADERKALWDIINAQKEIIDRLSREAKDK